MKSINLTPHELAQRTMEDITKRRKLAMEGRKQAVKHSMENRNKIQRKISHGRH